MTAVALSPSEIMFAAQAGVMRRVQNIKGKVTDRYGEVKFPWQCEIESSMAELAVAKHCGLYWNGTIGNTKTADVGRFQVRHTERENGCLLLHPEDKDEDTFILVIGRDGKYLLAGWIVARDAKLPQFWKAPQPDRFCFMVPQSVLHPMSQPFNPPG